MRQDRTAFPTLPFPKIKTSWVVLDRGDDRALSLLQERRKLFLAWDGKRLDNVRLEPCLMMVTDKMETRRKITFITVWEKGC